MCVFGSKNLVNEEHPRRSGETWTFAEALASSHRALSDPCLSSRPVVPKSRFSEGTVGTLVSYVEYKYGTYNTSTCV